MKKIVIAIDGFSGTGKSSTAKQVAKQLGYVYIDSGAMYRAVTLALIEKNIDVENHQAVKSCLDECQITFENQEVALNGIQVEDKIRTMAVNQLVSSVSAIPEVRTILVDQQRRIGEGKGVVMDGRDIGTVVFPNAELKIFMSANATVRAKRRMAELQQKGIEEDLESIKENLLSRDEADSTRADSPLKKALDAVEIDTSDITIEEQVNRIVDLAKAKIYES